MTANPKFKALLRERFKGPPPLENGARLSAAEFLRRYGAMPDVRKAELIEGIVLMPSPVRVAQHGEPDNFIQGWLFMYTASTPGLIAASNSTVKLDVDNVPQPDALMFFELDADGRERLDREGYLVSAPELVVEIAASSVSIDMHEKLRLYRRHGVREYLVWLAEEERIVWFHFAEGETAELPADARGRVASRVFPGLVLDVRAALARHPQGVLATLQSAMKSRAYREFSQRLAAPKPTAKRQKR